MAKLPKPPKLPKLPKLRVPKLREIPGLILKLPLLILKFGFGLLWQIPGLVRTVVGWAAAGAGRRLGPRLQPLVAKADAAFSKVPGNRIARWVGRGGLNFAKRRRDNAARRYRRVRAFIAEIPPPLEFPGWAYRGIINALRNPIIRWKIVLYSGATGLLILFAAAIQFPLTTNPVFCGSCHSQRPEFYTWSVSSHRRITCYSCHVKPGLYWLTRDHLIDGPLGMYKEFVDGYEDPINFKGHYGFSRMPVMNCQRCHSPGNRRFTTTRGLKMDHDKHLKLGVRCTVCHNRITHPLRGYKNNMKMQACFRCHGAAKNEEFINELEHLSGEREEYARFAKLASAVKADKAKPKCSLCHEPEWELKPRSHLLADWAPTQSYETPTYTGESRREQWEYQSLKISLQPRPAKLERIYQHARYAKQNPRYCYMCHNKEQFCSKCHKLDMPHIRPWWDRHGERVLATFKDSLGPNPSTIEQNVNKILCTKCHRSQNFCLDCHKATVFPHATPWAPIHGKLAKKQGFREVCTTCHNYQAFCFKCHGVEMPHSKRWLGKHFAYLKDKSSKLCMRCHQKVQCEKCHSRHAGHRMSTILNPGDFAEPGEQMRSKGIFDSSKSKEVKTKDARDLR